jgi:hypothetical protein
MHRTWYVYSFKEIPRLEGEMLPSGYFVQPVKCPFLVTDRNEKYTTYAAFPESDKVTVSKRSHA